MLTFEAYGKEWQATLGGAGLVIPRPGKLTVSGHHTALDHAYATPARWCIAL